MNKFLMTAALAGVAAASMLANGAQAQDEATAKDKCYGVAKAGKNACASSDGAHSCAGQAKADNLPTEWIYVAKGECEAMGGKLAAAGADKNSCNGKNSCKH